MKKQNENGKRKMAVFLTFAAVGVILLLLVAAATIVSWDGFLVNLEWFRAMGYEFYFWQREFYRYLVFALASGFFFLILFLNFWFASRFLEDSPERQQDKPRKVHHKIYDAFHTGSLLFYVPLCMVLSIFIAFPLYLNWESFLFFIFGPPTGLADPVFGKDASFYMFGYPIYTLVERRLLIAMGVIIVGSLLVYMVKNRLRERHTFHFHRGAKWHMFFLVMALFGLVIWEFMLQRYGLVFDRSHESLFFGPGFVQMYVTLPFLWQIMIVLALIAITLIVIIEHRKGYKVLILLTLLLAVGLTIRYTSFLGNVVQHYWVKPNEMQREVPFIANNIQATLQAYNLTKVEVNEFKYRRFPAKYRAEDINYVLRNIPLWNADILETVFKQMQELRTYYTFPLVSVGRYTVRNRYQQVFLAPREMNYDNLPSGARNWINRHLVYTHGFGAVVMPASQNGGQPMTWFTHNIPPESQYGLNTEQPRIYYGMGSYPYAIVPNTNGELDYPKGNRNVTSYYQGRGGVPLDSVFKRFLFYVYYRDRNLFFSTKYDPESKILLHRNIVERIRTLTPFLRLDRAPYLVQTTKGLYWIVDAYTTSQWYPASAPFESQEGPLNYIRNSVKIIIDAYNGSVNYYVFDPNDPIIRTYERIYPELFKTRKQIPDELKPHIRYPRDLFDIQMHIYADYHQTDPNVFFQQEDRWTFTEPHQLEKTVPGRPYFLTLDLIHPGNLDFLQLLPMFPKGRDNLRALAVAGCDGEDYGKLIVYYFPKGELVYGPTQVNALINQDPAIAQQFTLWDEAGSSVVRGKMIVLPIDNSVLFIQPVYLTATSEVKIPELQRVIMSEGQEVVMETTIEEAYNSLRQLVEKDKRIMQKSFELTGP